MDDDNTTPELIPTGEQDDTRGVEYRTLENVMEDSFLRLDVGSSHPGADERNY